MTTPLFVATTDALKSRLRLSGVPEDSTDTLAILDESILRARMAFYRRLGGNRVAQLKDIAEVEAPETDDQILRSLAGVVEVKLITVDLMRRLPSSWMDASGDQQKAWNEEAPFRERGVSDLEREITRLNAEIEEEMQMLAKEEQIGSEENFRVYDGTPDCTPPRPGDTLRPSYRNRSW